MSSFSTQFKKIENSADRLMWILVPLLFLIGIVLRCAGLEFKSIDIKDFLLDWYHQLAVGGFTELRAPFSNYTPPYLYLLFLMTRTAGLIPEIPAIKLLSIFFDFMNSFLIYKILKIKYPQGSVALIGAALFFLLPTVFLNSAYWGQADAIYTCFLLAFLFFLMKDKPFIAMIFLGIAFSFKAQAVFLSPLVLLSIIRKRIPWFYLAIVPVIYVLMMIPAAWTGRPWIELLTAYFDQAETYRRLSEHAPNLYLLMPSSFYKQGLIVGLFVTALVALVWVTVYARKIKEFTPSMILLGALTSAAFMPFFLPKMHDRYFYVAEVLSFLVAFYVPGSWWIAVGYQFVSGLVYFVVLTSSAQPMNPALAGNILILATFFNTALIGFLFWSQWKLINSLAEKN